MSLENRVNDNFLYVLYNLQNVVDCPRTLREMPFFGEPRLQFSFLWLHAHGTPLDICHAYAAFPAGM